MSLYRPKYRDPETGELVPSKVFWMDFHYQGQRIRESTEQTGITRAREVQAKRKQELRDSTSGIRKREAPKLFSLAFQAWTDAKRLKWSPRTLGITENSLKHLAPVFGKKLVVDIEAKNVLLYQRARLAEGASNRTINIEVGCLRAVLKRGGHWARIQPEVEMLPERDDVGRALSDQEEAILLEECRASRSRNLAPFVVVTLETGSRYGTVRRLQWENIDFANECLTFGRDKTRAGSGRTIPLTQRALETLRFWAERFPDRRPEHYVFPSERIGGAGADDTFGFTAAAVYETDPTKPVGSIKTAWRVARARTRLHCSQCSSGRLGKAGKPATGYVCSTCGWKTAELPRGLGSFRVHDLRHSAASRMIARRVPLPMIGRILGWSAATLAKMAKRYGHFTVEEMRAALEGPGAGNGGRVESGSPKNPPKWESSGPGGIQ